MFAEKLAGQFYKRFPEALELTKFQSRIKTIVSQKFSWITNTIPEQNISHVMDGACMLQLIFINLSGRISPESFDVTK